MHPIAARLRNQCLHLAVVIAVLLVGSPLRAQSESGLAPELRQRIDQGVREVLAKSGAPSASIAIVNEGQLAYLRAYGDARLEPRVAARPEMRYSIGSISKQFTAAAILLLAEQGKLSLEDPVERFVPNLTRAGEVTLRQLLSHTSGYQDYWPQDYVPPFMQRPISSDEILQRWARIPLDFDPGTKWQYSNTNYVIAGLIVEKASGMPFLDFLRANIFTPLAMQSVADVDRGRLTESDPAGYMRYALGPPRLAVKEGQGWLYAAGELAMTAGDLARWDISILQRRLLKPASYKVMETEVQLNNGLGTQYGLGVSVNSEAGRRTIAHGGEVSGFTASNVVYPDDGAAIVVLTNQDATSASGDISRRIAEVLFNTQDAQAAKRLAEARRIFEQLQRGAIDRSLLTDNASSYFSDQALQDFRSGLAPLGTPQEFIQTAQSNRGGMIRRSYRVRFPQTTLRVWTFEIPGGQLEQYQLARVD